MLSSKRITANAACAAGQATPLVRAPIRPLPLSNVQQQAQTLLVPRLSHAQAIGQRVRAAAVADGASAGAAAAVSSPVASSDAAGLQELDKDSFQPFIDAAGDKLVVVDFFTDWCGPCKLIYPQLVTLSAELAPAAVIVKFNCNQNNKELAKALGIKVAPTFHLYKGGQKVADMTGAKVDKLRELITQHTASDDGQQN
ncbi:hypothetical protein OEZ85_004245 [Tetradesmus obliquus]|uniref:Thioredoxin domain-containing protein n=1 Tax=Tetradesmus obliquus TaxID=3088 RepID=A0ABY8UKG3_TETOB|nr:hypothetical protein OEZ85_004245 [Tetradesmus obliquus]